MAKLFNLARMTTATTGPGTITLGSAVSGFLTFAAAGVANGDVVVYGIKDGASSEVGTGTYTSAGTTMTRSFTKSTTGSLLSLSGTAEVFISPRAEDIANLGQAQTFVGDQTISGSVIPSSTMTSVWTIDASSGPITIAASSSSAVFASGSGLVEISENGTSGDTAVFLIGNTTVKLISQTGTTFSVTTTPGAAAFGLSWDGASGYRIYNGSGATRVFTAAGLRTRTVV